METIADPFAVVAELVVAAPTVVCVGARPADAAVRRDVLAQVAVAAAESGAGVRAATTDAAFFAAGRPAARVGTLEELTHVVVAAAADILAPVVVVDGFSALRSRPGGCSSTEATATWLAAVRSGDLSMAFDAAGVPWARRGGFPPSVRPVSLVVGADLRDHLDPAVVEFCGGVRLFATAARRFSVDASGALCPVGRH